MKKAGLRRGNEDAFLHVGNEGAVLLFGALTIRDVLQDMHVAEMAAVRFGKRGVGGQEVASQPRVRLVSFPGKTLTIGTDLAAGAFDGKDLRDRAADERAALPANQLTEAVVAAQDATLT